MISIILSRSRSETNSLTFNLKFSQLCWIKRWQFSFIGVVITVKRSTCMNHILSFSFTQVDLVRIVYFVYYVINVNLTQTLRKSFQMFVASAPFLVKVFLILIKSLLLILLEGETNQSNSWSRSIVGMLSTPSFPFPFSLPPTDAYSFSNHNQRWWKRL